MPVYFIESHPSDAPENSRAVEEFKAFVTAFARNFPEEYREQSRVINRAVEDFGKVVKLGAADRIRLLGTFTSFFYQGMMEGYALKRMTEDEDVGYSPPDQQ